MGRARVKRKQEGCLEAAFKEIYTLKSSLEKEWLPRCRALGVLLFVCFGVGGGDRCSFSRNSDL